MPALWDNLKNRVLSWEKPFHKLAWPLTTLAIIVGIVIFFISYSLARHKKMVHQLRVRVLKLQTENKIAVLEKKKALEQVKLAQLQKKDSKNSIERDKIRNKIQKISAQEKEAKVILVKRRKELDKDNLDDLLKKANQLVKDTL